MNLQRYARICEMLARRQPDLTVCMEQVHKPHNVSAVIRTADAVGVHEVHAIWPGSRMRTMASAAAGSNSWVQVKTHRTIGEAVTHLKGQSLNVSVASALILYEAQRQRQNAGMYRRENSMLPEEDQQRLLFEGGYPVLAKVAKRKGLPYPHVNEQGEVEADAAWWATMQAAK